MAVDILDEESQIIITYASTDSGEVYFKNHILIRLDDNKEDMIVNHKRSHYT
ncbi:MAG: hypothetical protein IKE91_07110 [Clostridia bacterium]|nr:hypothetical protein [Clostridia bacterium]